MVKFKLHAKMTESQWQGATERFVASVTQAAFALVGWAMIIAAVSYFHDQSGHWTLWIAEILLHFLLIARIYTYITYQIDIELFEPQDDPPRWKFWTTILVNVVFVSGLYIGSIIFVTSLTDTLTILQSEGNAVGASSAPAEDIRRPPGGPTQ